MVRSLRAGGIFPLHVADGFSEKLTNPNWELILMPKLKHTRALAKPLSRKNRDGKIKGTKRFLRHILTSKAKKAQEETG